MSDPLSNACAALAKSNALLIQVTQERDEVSAERDALKARADELLEMLAEIQWDYDSDECQICGGVKPGVCVLDATQTGHRDACRLRLTLEGRCAGSQAAVIAALTAERDMYRDALNCRECEATGSIACGVECPACKEAREKARGV